MHSAEWTNKDSLDNSILNGPKIGDVPPYTQPYIPPYTPGDIPVPTWGQQGWICPKCGKVYSPSVDNCSSCNGGKASQYDREKAQKRLHELGINMDKVCRIRLYIPDIDSVKIEDEYWLFKSDGVEFKLNFSDMSVLQYVKGEYIITDLSKTLKELIKGHLIY